MIKRFLAPLLVVGLVMAMVVPGCGEPTPTDTYRLTMAVSPAGAGTATDVAGELLYLEGAEVSISAAASVGFSFVEWSAPAGTFDDATAAETTFTMPGEAVTVTANFEKELAPYYEFIASEYGARGLGLFATEAATRFDNLRGWFGTYGHFWVNSGPMYVQSLNPVAGFVQLERFADYPDDADRWVFLMGLDETGEGRKGSWVDKVVITEEASSAAAITRLQSGDIDIFAFSITDADLVPFPAGIKGVDNVGSYNEFSFNPIAFFNEGTADEAFNPFGIREIRECLNVFIDRSFITDDIMGGLALPRFTGISGVLPDGVLYADIIADIEAKYEHTPANIADWEAIFEAEMLAAGAFIDGGTWHYDHGANGGVKEIDIMLIVRTEDERLQMGAYLDTILQDLGFKTTVQELPAAQASPIWLFGDPADGEWNAYTGGWVTTVVSRDQGGNFAFFYTNMSAYSVVPLWASYVNTPEFYAAAEALDQRAFSTMIERRALFEEALYLSMEDSARIWLTDNQGSTPMRDNINLAADLAGGVYGSWMWALTVHFMDESDQPTVGGTLNVAMPSILTQPWNPIAGSNWVYDMFPIRATGDMAHHPDTTTGLRWDGRLEKAEITVETGLPVTVTNDWVELNFAGEITVPGDAWADWDAAEQRFITAAERFPGGATAKRKSVAYYPDDIFDVPLHDGNTLSLADFLYGAILTFDRAKEDSGIFDPATVPGFNSFMTAFKGMRFLTDVPGYGLVVEYYSDVWYIDAELGVAGMFPVYAQGPGKWHTLALGIWAEEAKSLCFSSAKASSLGVEWMHFLSGPSIGILKGWLDFAPTAS